MIDTKSWRTRALALAFVAGGLAACGGATGRPGSTASAPAAEGVRPAFDTADVAFMSSMIRHHTQAIEMSHLAPSRGASAPVQRLAERILNAQHDEIATMRRWLRDRGQPVPDSLAATSHSGHASHEAHPMPGMLTDAELRALGELRGSEFDRRFLALMIRHHRGAVTMVERLFQRHGAAQDESVFRIASDISADQTTEIARMQQMLTDLLTERNPQ
jgi:uncharacterized protein (DUF305 family)